jgi:NAD(P)H-flavin reductase
VKPGKKSAAAAVAEATAAAAVAAATATEPPAVQLADPRVRYSLPLVSKQRLNPDTFLLRFALASPQTRLGLPCGKHVYMFADIGGEAVARAYTPLSGDQDLGVLDLLIKVYWAGVHPNFPEGGKMTQYLANMEVGVSS